MSASLELFAEIAVRHVYADIKRISNDCRGRGRDQAGRNQIRKEEGRFRSGTNDGEAQDGDSDGED